MKRFLFVVTMAAALAAGCTGGKVASVTKPDWFTNETYFEEKNGMYEEMPVYPSNIVMIGDDYIDRGIWHEFFGDTTIKNRGITYDATPHVLYRISRIAAQRPRKIFVSVGRNDVLHGTPADAIVGNIGQIFKRIHKESPKTKCYWLNIVGTADLSDAQENVLEAVNEQVKAMAGKGDFEVIDINSALSEGIGEGKYSWDGGKFLNGAGYEVLAQTIERQIGKPHLNHADDREYPLEVSDYYKHRVSLFRSLPESDFKIVMLGNSLMNNGMWTELFPMGYLVNRGISGDVIDGVRQRLDEIVADKPAKIYLITGTNDLVNDPNLPAIEAWNRYEKLLKEVRDLMPGSMLYVQSMLPLNPKSKFYEGFNARAAEINKMLEAGKDRYDYFYIDIASRLSDEKGDLDERYTTDGIHLNATGYFVWAAELAKGSRMMVQF